MKRFLIFTVAHALLLTGGITMTTQAEPVTVTVQTELGPIAAQTELNPIAAQTELNPIAAQTELNPITAQTELDPIAASDIYETPTSVVMPMDSLRVTEKVTQKDIDHTMEYIEKTKKGEMKKREPLTVVERGDGTYSIIDGNRSYSALKELGAKNIPVEVVSRPYHKDLKTFNELITIQSEAESEFHQLAASLAEEYKAELSEHSDLKNPDVIHKKAKENFGGDYAKVIDVLSAELLIPAKDLPAATEKLIGSSPHQAETNRISPSLEEAYPPKAGFSPASLTGEKGLEKYYVLCIYSHEEDNGYTAYIRLSNGAIVEIRLNEKKLPET